MRHWSTVITSTLLSGPAITTSELYAIFILALGLNVAKTITASIVGARIDYCNALLYGAGQSVFAKLQRVQNNFAHVVCNVGRRRVYTQLVCCVTSTSCQSVIV